MSSPLYFDLVEEETLTGGTGTFSLAGATIGHRAWSTLGNGNSGYYMARGASFAEWETGLGTVSGGTLTRSPLASSNGGSLVNFTGSLSRLANVLPATVITAILAGYDGGTPITRSFLPLPRRGTAAAWASANPMLAVGEEGFETDTLRTKTGDGTTHWADLNYWPVTRPDLAVGGGVIFLDNAAQRLKATSGLVFDPDGTGDPTGTGTINCLYVGNDESGSATIRFRDSGDQEWVEIAAGGGEFDFSIRHDDGSLTAAVIAIGSLNASSTVSAFTIQGTVGSFAQVTGDGIGLTNVATVKATGYAASQTGAKSGLATFTPPADGLYEVSGYVNVVTATNHSFAMTCTYTDEKSVSRTLTLPFVLVAGSAIVNTVANANGTVPYMGMPMMIRAKASTAITLQTTGTFTTVSYDVGGTIKKVN